MKELHDALTWLGPVEWNEVPTGNLVQYVSDCLAAGELIAASVPHNFEGTPFNASKPSHSEPNRAKSHKDVTVSEARSYPAHEDHEKLQKSWGKPYKFKKEENPLGVSLYKMAGNDRHGAWFARRSMHEGIGFDKFKRAMMREFSQALKVQGEPGAGAIRGIAADRRLERMDIPEVGKLEVYELSAAFPGPVTPRDFVAMIISSDSALSAKSAADVGGKKHLPRHFMVVSKPVAHPDAPARSGLVRGQYESVELIREIPLSTANSTSTTDLLKRNTNDPTANGDHAGDLAPSHEPELNPVEWIMVTRSDPGGGIPRFLVERGTPSAMLQDQNKFFDWACALDEIPHPDDDLDEQRELSAQQAGNELSDGGQLAPFEVNGSPVLAHGIPRSQDSPIKEPGPKLATPTTTNLPETEQGGYFSGITNALGAGIEAYAPTSVSSVMLQHLQPEPDLSDDSSDTSSVDSFMSAEDLKVTTAPEIPGPAHSTDNFSIMSGDVSEGARSVKTMSHHEKEVHKLVQKREKLEQQLAKKRMAEEQKLREAQEKEQSESGKSKEKIQRELKKTEEKHRKDIEKLEAKKAKEERKAEEKRRKKDEQNKISLVTRERDDFRSQVDLFRRENSLLRDQVADLQSTNNVLAQRLGALGGQEALKGIDEMSVHKRSASVQSTQTLSRKTEAVTAP